MLTKLAVIYVEIWEDSQFFVQELGRTLLRINGEILFMEKKEK